MNDQMQELTEQEAAAVMGGSWWAEVAAFTLEYYGGVVADAFLTQQSAGSFDWAGDK